MQIVLSAEWPKGTFGLVLMYSMDQAEQNRTPGKPRDVIQVMHVMQSLFYQ
jgi:hypothetical protein